MRNMFIITIDHKKWRQRSKWHNADGQVYRCFLGVGRARSDFQRLMRSRINTTDHLAFASGHPFPTGLESTDSRATGLAHDCGTSVLDTRGKTRYRRDRSTSETIATKEGSESTWRATGRGGNSGVTFADVSVGRTSVQSRNWVLQRFHVRHGLLPPQ